MQACVLKFHFQFLSCWYSLPVNNRHSNSFCVRPAACTDPLFLQSEAENTNSISVTEQRKCRHEVRIFDELSNDKIKYKSQKKAIEGYFHIYEYDDTYCKYREDEKNDKVCITK